MSHAPLVFVGVAAHDTIACVRRFPEPDQRVVVDDLVTAGGGPAATAAVAAARRSAAVAFVGAVGDDETGTRIVDGLASEGVDVSGVLTVRGARSAASVVIVDTARATRTILNLPPTPTTLDELPEAAHGLLAGADWLHVDQVGWSLLGSWWRSAADRPRLSIDAGNPLDDFSPAGVDLYVPTVAALRDRYGDPPDREPAALLRRALDDGARTVVATDGARGAHAMRSGGPPLRIPAVDGPVRSTLGAGDVFHGALLAAVARGDELGDAVTEASTVAYRSCQELDGRSGIPALTPERSTR